jgi:pyruvate,water dikinase
MDTAYDQERLLERPDLILPAILELAEASRPRHQEDETESASALERRLLAAVGEKRKNEALEVLSIAKLSWRLRDDDNILLGRIESQLLRALELAGDRLRDEGRLTGAPPREGDLSHIIKALRDPVSEPLSIANENPATPDPPMCSGEYPRQLVGQPAAPGIVTGKVCSILKAEDLKKFRAGEILLCDSIQPTMTHLLPMAAAVVESRGGMLIHGAIIARELGIPCANGIPRVTDIIRDGEVVTVDGYLGIVTVGEPEFDLEGSIREKP